MSPHAQVQGGIKMAYQETPALLLLFPYLAEQVTPLPSIQGQDLLRKTTADNKTFKLTESIILAG
jgi:hypothetical protein